MAKSKSPQEDLEAATFESALGELEEIVHRLEAGDTGLEGAIEAYERGVHLKKHCQDKLREAQLRVEKIETGADGSIQTEPLETD